MGGGRKSQKLMTSFPILGLRPHRTYVRVEKELRILANETNLKIIHHYGHCGYGVLSSPGSSITVSQLVNEALTGNMQN